MWDVVNNQLTTIKAVSNNLILQGFPARLKFWARPRIGRVRETCWDEADPGPGGAGSARYHYLNCILLSPGPAFLSHLLTLITLHFSLQMVESPDCIAYSGKHPPLRCPLPLTCRGSRAAVSPSQTGPHFPAKCALTVGGVAT